MKAFVVFLALGFVISVMISWASKRHPQGLKRTRMFRRTCCETANLDPRKFTAFIVAVAVIAAGLLAFNLFRTNRLRSNNCRANYNEVRGRARRSPISVTTRAANIFPMHHDELLTVLQKIPGCTSLTDIGVFFQGKNATARTGESLASPIWSSSVRSLARQCESRPPDRAETASSLE